MQIDKKCYFFIENILWNGKKAVPLHADCERMCFYNQNAFFNN